MKKRIIVAFIMMSFALSACVSQKDYDALAEENEDLAKQVKDLKNENEDLYDLIEGLESEKEDLSDQIASFQNDMDKEASRVSVVNMGTGDLNPLDPPDSHLPSRNLDNFHDVIIRVDGREVSAFTNDTIFLLYASSPEGNTGWYLYDSVEGRWIRYEGILKEAEIVSDSGEIMYYVAERYYRSPQRTGEDEESDSIIPLDPPANENEELLIPCLSENFHDVIIRINVHEVLAYTNDSFYVFYAKSPEGNYGWYVYDSAEGRWIRFVFDYR